MKRKTISSGAALALAIAMLTGCTPAVTPEVAETFATSVSETDIPAEPVVLTVAGSWTECRAIEEVGRAFTAQYPNCTIEYEFLQDYYASVGKRMTGDDKIDLFMTTNIQEGNELIPNLVDLNNCEGLDLSNTFPGLIENFEYREDGVENKKLYAIPLGAEMRGMYVNKTLLDSLDIDIPTNQKTFLDACEKLKQNGYIPLQGNPSGFSQTLMYPWICNTIANADDPQAAYAMVDSREEGMTDMFSEPFGFMYSLVENGYYDYKKAQTELNNFNEADNDTYAKNFLGIKKNGEEWEKVSDVGDVAFMPSALSVKSVIDKTKEDFHSEIEYVFMPAPVGKDGGFVYLSPAHGIAANKNSDNLEWSIKFLDFLFTPENNEIFAEQFNVIPNTIDAFSYVKTLYDVPENRISHLGQVTFSYGFYGVINETLIDISKGNNPKYMKVNDDNSVSMYPLDYYMNKLEESVKAQ